MREPYFCIRCGEQYNPVEQEPPEDATFYWMTHCPFCKCTNDTVVDKTWMKIVSDSLTRDTDDINEYELDCVQAYARLLHGRMVDVDNNGLIERAKFFDEKARHNNLGPRGYHDVAFALRKQARQKDA